MLEILAGKRILLGVTGSIAAYKAVEWLRNLRKARAEVTVIMTTAACKFVTPLTFEALSGSKVHLKMFGDPAPESIPHISLGQEHDLLLIAPATAHTISRLAQGSADDLLSAVSLAASCPILLAPTMNSNMFTHPATTRNIEMLRQFGCGIIEPESGKMACGSEGPGRLAEWSVALDAILRQFLAQDLRNRTVLITAGPTEEPLDPVRFLSNRSSGRMGLALARAAHLRGARVILVRGPGGDPNPSGIRVAPVRTALEMKEAVEKFYPEAHIVIKAAAVSDFRPQKCVKDKIKKGEERSQLPLTANPDILRGLGARIKEEGQGPVWVGFAAESNKHAEEGLRKLKEKNLDMIVVNDIISPESGFGGNTNRVTIFTRQGASFELPLLSKEQTAMAILDKILELPALMDSPNGG